MIKKVGIGLTALLMALTPINPSPKIQKPTFYTRVSNKLDLAVYNSWYKDYNEDNVIDNRELRGLGEKNFYLDKDDFEFCVSNNKKGSLTLRLWKITPGAGTEGFEKIGEESMYYSGGKKAIRVSIDSKQPYFRDVLKKIYLSKSGKYRLSACFNDKNGKYEQKDIEFNIIQ